MKFKNLTLLAAASVMLTICPISAFAAEAEPEEEFVPEVVFDVPEEEQAVVFASDFEDKSIGKWVPFGGDATLSIDTENPHDSSACLKVTNRSQTYQGPSVSCDSFLEPGEVYHFDSWVRQDTGSAKVISWTLKYVDSTGITVFVGVDSNDIASGEWTQMGGNVELPDDASAISFYFECSNAASDFMIDDIAIMGRKSNGEGADSNSAEKKGVIKSFDFESGKENWLTRGDEHLIHTDEYSHTGNRSIYSSGRVKTWNGPSVDIDSIIERGKEYFYSAYIMYNGSEYEDSHIFRFELEYTLDGAANYMLMVDKEIEKGKWTEISCFYTVPENAQNLHMYLQTDNPPDGVEPDSNDLLSFYVDTVTISDGAYVRKQNKIKLIAEIIIGVIILAIIGVIAYFLIKNIKKNRSALEAAERDAMTHAFNRNTYEKKIAELKESPEQCKSLYFALCDVNFLKYINDNFGHKSGDSAITRCAKMLISTVGSDGDVYRTGGDEFVCISRKPIKEKITQASTVESAQESSYPFAVASGFAEYNSKLDGDTPDITKIIARCDKEMYKHKQKIKAENKEFSRK